MFSFDFGSFVSLNFGVRVNCIDRIALNTVAIPLLFVAVLVRPASKVSAAARLRAKGNTGMLCGGYRRWQNKPRDQLLFRMHTAENSKPIEARWMCSGVDRWLTRTRSFGWGTKTVGARLTKAKEGGWCSKRRINEAPWFSRDSILFLEGRRKKEGQRGRVSRIGTCWNRTVPEQQIAWRVSALFPVLSALSSWEDAAVESSWKQPSGCLMKRAIRCYLNSSSGAPAESVAYDVGRELPATALGSPQFS